MSNISLSVENFESRLNLESFTNIEKGIKAESFRIKYPNSKFLVFEESAIEKFIDNVNNEVGGEIKKGGFNDTEESKKVIEKAKEELMSLTKIRLVENDSTRYVYVKERGEENLKKSHVTSALGSGYGNNPLRFKKTGKAIKERVSNIKNEISVKLSECEKEISDLQEKFVSHPTNSPSTWGIEEGINCPYKIFNWNQTYYYSEDGASDNRIACEDANGDCVQPCGSQEEAEVNRKYNDCVYKWIDCQAEIKTLDMYLNNLDDNTSYELNSEQMITLKF